MINPTRARVCAVIFAALAAAHSALGQAGGLAFPDQGGIANGTAQSGQAAMALDATTAWLNTAGLTRIEGTQFVSAVMPFELNMEFDPGAGTTVAGNDGGNAGDWFLGGSFYLSHQLDEIATFGFSMTGAYGLGIDYDDGWVGRFFVDDVDLVVINFEPAIAFKLDNEWSLGVGLDIQFADFEQSLTNPIGPGGAVDLDGDSWEIGYSLGLMYEPSETTRFGLRYREEVNHDLEGDLNILNDRDISTDFLLPRSLTFSAYHQINEQWAIMGDVGWTDWSAFEENVIAIDAGPGVVVALSRDFKDTWNTGFGLHYRPTPEWLLMTGISYVSSAVDTSDRTPDLPTDEQWRFSLGGEYTFSDRFRLGISYTYADLGDNDIRATNPSGTVQGDYDANAHIIGIYGVVNF